MLVKYHIILERLVVIAHQRLTTVWKAYAVSVIIKNKLRMYLLYVMS